MADLNLDDRFRPLTQDERDWLSEQNKLAQFHPDYRDVLTGDLYDELSYLEYTEQTLGLSTGIVGEYYLKYSQYNKQLIYNELAYRKKKRGLPSAIKTEFSREKIQELKRKTRISDILGEGKGRKYKVKCPLHGDDTPSLSVNEDAGVWHCFGCQQGGDVIRLIMMMKRMSFREAIKELDGDKPVT